MDHQPLHLDSIAIKFLLHSNKERILVLPLGAFVIITLTSKIHRRWLIHVSLPLVVSKHHLAVQLQLRTSSRNVRNRLFGFVCDVCVCVYVCEVSAQKYPHFQLDTVLGSVWYL